ncbi:hypothetical protein GRAN_0993 [Granulicella sibirica]|uniref:Uncharacterized protein n=1 Tax=Granulicella sibirica TaxID=2479048 RepID=A0A4Q0T257_9BACT|nr:hypothetical protein GRAN_0993 [Granulicella sibirica]
MSFSAAVPAYFWNLRQRTSPHLADPSSQSYEASSFLCTHRI